MPTGSSRAVMSSCKTPLGAAFAAGLSFLISLRALALDFEYGELRGSWDTTLSFGQAFRVTGRDKEIIGLANGGKAFSVNGDNGDLNYGKGGFSSIGRLTTEIELRYRNFGTFFRGFGFRDFEADNTDRTPLSSKAKRLVEDNLVLRDAYGWARFDLGTLPFEIRVGEQVISWGESTFIQNGINIINPFDVSKLRVPGSEIRDALKPVGIVWAQLAVTDNATLEGYYQYDYERTLLEPEGSYFSTNDIAGDGATRLLLGFGDVSDLGTTIPGSTTGVGPLAAGPGGFDRNFDAVLRRSDDRPGQGGEYGVALRIFAPKLRDTEFGFYFINYHSRLPVVNARAGTQAGVGNAVAAGVAANALATGAAPTPTAAAAIGAAAGTLFGADNAAAAAAIGADCAFAAGIGAVPPEFVGSGDEFVSQCAIDQFGQTASYFLEYPKDIKLFGISFNTVLGISGWALQGEYSFRHDAPLQIDIQELVLAAGTPLATPTNNPALLDNQITNGGTASPGSEIPGFIQRDVSQLQMTATKVFGPTLKAEQFTLVGEFGVTHVHDMPRKSALRLEAPGTNTSGNPGQAEVDGFHAGKPAERGDDFPDSTSAGYQMRGEFEYNNVIGPINVLPRFAWRHDISGNTPGPGGNFLADRKAITLGLGFTYQNEWQADISYTNFFGAGRHNLGNDRDFVAFSLQYSF